MTGSVCLEDESSSLLPPVLSCPDLDTLNLVSCIVEQEPVARGTVFLGLSLWWYLAVCMVNSAHCLLPDLCMMPPLLSPGPTYTICPPGGPIFSDRLTSAGDPIIN